MATDSSVQQADKSQNTIQSVAFCLALSVAVCACIYFEVSGGGRFSVPAEIRLESRINPNNAPLASLSRLPGVGEGRAAAIVSYRESLGGGKAFQSCADLQKVKGIGPKTAANLCQWLKFE
ncbi:MAG: helix-hairpin-helix domain-containing protein [Sedimentisphaerales bacterium]|nr:helix-hairpin-helix domain-containing protein [Sedimentisphaerales bacterium]